MKQIIQSYSQLVVNHCVSCHEDEEMGYEMAYLFNFRLRWEAEVCCLVVRAIREGIDGFAAAMKGKW